MNTASSLPGMLAPLRSYAVDFSVRNDARGAIALRVGSELQQGKLNIDPIALEYLQRKETYENPRPEVKTLFQRVGWTIVEGACIIGPLGRQSRPRVPPEILEVCAIQD